MKKRVLIAGLFHETHTFLDGTTGLSDFQILRGEEMLRCEGDSSPLGGVLACAREFDWQVLPTVDYRAQPSATVEDTVFEQFWAELEQEITTQNYDAIYLVLHGAMVTESLRDVEGEFLTRIRRHSRSRVFGVFDLHANFSFDMTSLANCLVGYQENPHTDAREAACMAARLLERSFNTGIWPVMSQISPAIVWPPTGTATANDPMKSLNAIARKLEQDCPLVWNISIVAGFSFADTPNTGVSIVSVIDNTSGWATMKKNAQGQIMSSPAIELLGPMLDYLRKHRALGNVIDSPLAEVMTKLPGFTSGLTVLVEPSDNIGGGAPGDGTGLLRALIDCEVANSAICIADPAAVEKARAAGIGSKVSLSIGGKGSRLDAGPFDLVVEVISFSNGRFELEDKQSHLSSMCGDRFDMGPSALVRHRGITILLTSIKTPPFDLGQWRSQGIEPTRLSVICVKAAVAHRRAYDPIAARMFRVDTPGPCSSNLKTLPYKHIRRPIYPLDP